MTFNRELSTLHLYTKDVEIERLNLNT